MIQKALDWARKALPRSSQFDYQALKAEASFRSFYRVHVHPEGSPPSTAILMISPPEREQNARFETLAAVFEGQHIPVPRILARHRDHGWYLLSDLGGDDLQAIYDAAAAEAPAKASAGEEGPCRQAAKQRQAAALTAAIDTLARLQQVRNPAIPPYTPERLTDELGIFSEWFAGRALGAEVPPSVLPVLGGLVDRAAGQRQCCVHRDYHCRNLLFNDGRLGIVDFQDALMGPLSYDLASLLHDCYHTFSAEEVAHWMRYYLSIVPGGHDPEIFQADLEQMAVQRQLKAVGIFARLKLRDGRSTHLVHIAPVLDHVRLLARRHPALSPLADWLDTLDAGAAVARLERA